jgi:1,4-dihydroxy-2-naphthoate octaprenyltransferase
MHQDGLRENKDTCATYLGGDVGLLMHAGLLLLLLLLVLLLLLLLFGACVAVVCYF